MKASFGTVNMKTSTDVEECTESTVGRSRLLKWACLCMVGLVLLSGIVLAAFYLGSTVNRHTYKSVWKTLINKDDPQQRITEKVVVTETEADVTRPGVIRIILDTKAGHLTFLEDTPVSSDDRLGPCYVADVDVKGDLNSVKSRMTAEHIEETVPFTASMHEFDLTQDVVAMDTLSPRTRDMCFGRPVFKANEVTKAADHRVRRDVRVRLFWGLIDVEFKKSGSRKEQSH